jgi:hypothetical protein
MIIIVPRMTRYMSSNLIPKPMLNRFVQRKSYKAERSKKEIPEVHAFNNTAIIGANPKMVRTKPRI